jgi:LysR family hydrogen peroxide-inducible transcriptional activator
LGIKIFERGKNEVSITPVGAEIVEQAQRALEEVARIRELARQGKDQLASTLRLGIIYSVGPYLLPDLVPALKKLAPGMPLEIEENITANLDTCCATASWMSSSSRCRSAMPASSPMPCMTNRSRWW